MVSAIIYTSQTGFTRRYAELLGRDAALPVYNTADWDFLPAEGTEAVYLGWLSAGRIKGLSEAQKRWKVRAVCAVGMSPENDPKAVAERNRVECPVFCVQGGYAPEKLKGMDKLVMSVVTKLIVRTQAKKVRTAEERAQLEQFSKGCDFVDENNLAPLLAWLREEAT